MHGKEITARARRRRRHRPSPFLFLPSLSFRLNKWTDVFGTVHSRRRAREPSSTHTRSTARRCYTSAGLCGQKRWPFALGVASCEPSIGQTRRGEDKPKRCRPADHCTSQGERRGPCLATASTIPIPVSPTDRPTDRPFDNRPTIHVKSTWWFSAL